MRVTVDTYETLNDVLVNLFRDVMDLEEKAIITQEFKDITNNDMHAVSYTHLDVYKRQVKRILRPISRMPRWSQ